MKDSGKIPTCKSLSFRLTAVVLAVCATGMGAVAAMSVLSTWNSLLYSSIEQIKEFSAKEAERIDGFMDYHVGYVTAIATDMAFADPQLYSTGEGALPLLARHTMENTICDDLYIGHIDGRITFASGAEPDYESGFDVHTRDWFQDAVDNPGRTIITPPYADFRHGGLCISTVRAIASGGEVVGVVGSDVLLDSFSEMMEEADLSIEGGYSFLIGPGGDILYHADRDYWPQGEIFRNITEIGGGLYTQVWEETRNADNVHFRMRGFDGSVRYYAVQTIDATGWKLYTTVPASGVHGPIYRVIAGDLAVLALVLLAAAVIIRVLLTRIVIGPVREVTQAARELTKGGVNVQIKRRYQDEIGEMVDSIHQMTAGIRLQTEVTQSIARGDLTEAVPVRSEQDLMGHALLELRQSLSDIVARILTSADAVDAGSSEISTGSHQLASSAQQQARSMMELTAAVSRISQEMEDNAGLSHETGAVNREITENAREGAAQLERMIRSVEAINESTSKISHIIKAIEDIAFQTNILSLNAAVEAARAGEQGRGFAVVAEEVRSLAGLSANAAHESAALISDCVSKVAEGMRMAESTGRTFETIIAGIGKNVDATDSVVDSTWKLNDAIQSINEEIEQVFQAVNGTAAVAEQSAAMAVGLSQEAKELAKTVHRFRLGGDAPPPAENGGFSLRWESDEE